MEKQNKAQQIVHEAEITRQHARYKIPASMEIEGKTYKIFDWSVSGAGIEGIEDEIYNKKFVVGKMFFKFDDFVTVIDNLKLEFVIKRPNGVVGVRFTELTPQQISILNQIISSYLAGDIITEDDIIHAVTRANFSPKKEVKAKVDKKKSIITLLILWFVILGLIGFLLFVMYQRVYIVKTENGYIDSDITIIRAPSPSYIKFAKQFNINETISKNEALVYSNLVNGGLKIIKSPVDGKVLKIMNYNGDFRNVGEPIMAILNKHHDNHIVVNITHKNLKKVKVGDIAKVRLENGVEFFAKIVNIKYPYNVYKKHAKILDNVYNQPRSYDTIRLEPINYTISDDLIGTSVVVTIDTLLNKYKWYSLKENKSNIKTEEKTSQPEKVSAENNTDTNIQDEKQPVKIEQSKEVEQSTKVEIQATNTQDTQSNTQTTENTDTKLVDRYCIIAASSNKPITDQKSQQFINTHNNAKLVKVGNVYELKISSFETFPKSMEYLKKSVKPYYKDAFIIKCKVKSYE